MKWQFRSKSFVYEDFKRWSCDLNAAEMFLKFDISNQKGERGVFMVTSNAKKPDGFCIR